MSENHSVGNYQRVGPCYPSMKGAELRASRKHLHLTLEQAAMAFGGTKSAWSRWENGSRPVPGYIETAVRQAIVPTYDPRPPQTTREATPTLPPTTAEHLHAFCRTFGLTPEMAACLTGKERKEFLRWYNRKTIPAPSFLITIRRLIRHPGQAFLHWASQQVTTADNGQLDYQGLYHPRDIKKQLLKDWEVLK